MEIRIESVNKDNSHSWVRISHGLNKLVTDLIDKEYDDNEQETSETKTEVFALKTEVFTYASRSKAKAKPRRLSTSAPCGGKFDVLSLVLCAFSAGVASLAVGFVLGTCTLLRVMGKCWWTWSFPADPAQDVGFLWRCWRWPWRGGQLGNSEDAEKPNKSYYDPRKWLREVEFFMVVILTGEGPSQVQDLLLLDVTPLSMNGFGDCRSCHDEVHRTQHHHSHEERYRRSRRTLTTSRVFSSCNVHCGAASITAM